MAYGLHSVYTDTILSGASTSSGIHFNAAFDDATVQITTMSTSAALNIQGSVDAGTTWWNVFHPTINSSTTATNLYTIASSVGTSGGIVPLPTTGFIRIRFLTTGVVSGGVGFKVVISR